MRKRHLLHYTFPRSVPTAPGRFLAPTVTLPTMADLDAILHAEGAREVDIVDIEVKVTVEVEAEFVEVKT